MNNQKGISLIVTFLIMTVMLAVALGLITALFTEVKIAKDTGNSVSSFYSADSGAEKTLYLIRSSPQTGFPGIAAGFCGICDACTDCSNCALTEFSVGGCEANQCNDCRITYTSVFDGRKFDIDARIDAATAIPGLFTINSRGFYLNKTRTSWFREFLEGSIMPP